jgi:hypothetical protein
MQYDFLDRFVSIEIMSSCCGADLMLMGRVYLVRETTTKNNSVWAGKVVAASLLGGCALGAPCNSGL